MVLALERFVIPSGMWQRPNYSGELHIDGIYQKSLCKFATSMCKGRFQQFILDNILELAEGPPTNYIAKFQQALKNNKVRTIDN